MDNTQRAALAAELAKPKWAAQMAAQAYAEIAAALNNRPMKANPTPRPQVDKRMTVEDFVKALKPGEVVTVYQNGALVGAYAAALQGDDRKLARALWRGLKTLVSAETVAAIEALQDAKEADPTWQAQVPGPSIAETLGLGVVTERDVQAVEQGRWQ